MNRRSFLTRAIAGVGAVVLPRPAWPGVTPGGASAAGDGSAAGETLYNGIRLASPWPPQRESFTTEPLLPPYLADPPAIIPIDVGRQLFVDDFLIEETTLDRTYHHADYYPGNPVLRPTTRWEKYDEYAERTHTRSNPSAMVFSDGVFFDPSDRLFKMWYMGGYSQNTCYATSNDGVTWEKPSLDYVPGTNIVWRGLRDSTTVWLDQLERDPARRFKMTVYNGSERRLELWVSRDGKAWASIAKSGHTGDRTTFFYNPFRNVWVYSIRAEIPGFTGRVRRYWETPDFNDVHWKDDQPVLWAAADSHDPRRPEYNVPAELYNLDCAGYESLMLGLFTIFRGERDFREKPNELVVGYSRDGFHWHRPDRRAFIPVSEHVGDWNWGNVQSAGGVCLVVGDKLHFYVSGRRGVPGTNDPGICSTGLATLRRDGFASLAEPLQDAPVRRVGGTSGPLSSVTTRPVRFSGGYLFVNADARAGEVRAEVLDEMGRVIAPFSSSSCRAVHGDSTKAVVTWDRGDLKDLAGRAVRFRFYVRGARLYAFWVSRFDDGRSGGYVAAGGPGFSGPADV